MSLLIKILAYIYEDNQVREPTTLDQCGSTPDMKGATIINAKQTGET